MFWLRMTQHETKFVCVEMPSLPLTSRQSSSVSLHRGVGQTSPPAQHGPVRSNSVIFAELIHCCFKLAQPRPTLRYYIFEGVCE